MTTWTYGYLATVVLWTEDVTNPRYRFVAFIEDGDGVRPLPGSNFLAAANEAGAEGWMLMDGFGQSGHPHPHWLPSQVGQHYSETPRVHQYSATFMRRQVS
ncbi:hypothetical protein [Plantactinospora sp. WMMB782]|uniref:hypothetical protein n=1 Tax=Plantactinospora sp. WMMB782 TaxID=3404121 RepID=UPI003B944E51